MCLDAEIRRRTPRVRGIEGLLAPTDSVLRTPEIPLVMAGFRFGKVAGTAHHRKGNGEPGWLVVGRGMHDLLLLELGWRAREEAEL